MVFLNGILKKNIKINMLYCYERIFVYNNYISNIYQS